jgi:two-component sensor histidine kinase
LSELLEELLTNAGKHVSPERDPELSINVAMEQGVVFLSVRNAMSQSNQEISSCSASDPISGRGLRRLRQLLEPFNAKLAVSNPTDPSTVGDAFEVTVQIERAEQ